MPIRVTGLNSGMETDTIIKELVKAERAKIDSLKKSQTKLQWKQDAWKELNNKMKNLFNKTMTSMSWSGSYMKKATTVSNTSAVSIITGENAVNCVQSLQIVQQAKTGYLTGGQLSKTGAYTAASKLSDLDSTIGEGVLNLKSGGKTTAIKINGDTTISDVLTQLKGAGVNASFDEKNQRFYIIAKESGEASDFSLTASDANGSKALKALKIDAPLDKDSATLAEYTEFAKYYNDALGNRNDTLANMSSLITGDIAAKAAAYKKSNEDIATSITGLNDKISVLTSKDGYEPDKSVLEAAITAKQAELDAAATDEEKAERKQELDELNAKLADTKQVEAYNDEITRLRGVKANNDQYINPDGSATAQLTQEVEDAFYNKAAYAAQVIASGNLSSGGANKVSGQDAKIMLNDAEYTSTNNVFEVNGLTITVLNETAEKITVTTQEDTKGIYDMIKKFIKEYNTLIIEMDKLNNADSARKYEPLTDEEKEAMSESDVEKWEQKIKDSLLRRDSSMTSVANTMSNIMMAGVEVNGEKMFLSSFGIKTLGYFDAPDNEKRAFHIDGDQDDANTSGKTDKLQSAIANDPTTVMKFFTGLSKNLNDAWAKLSATSEISSYNTAYNDKLMKQQYEDYSAKIAKQEARLTAMEDKWYSKFTAMETALARLQSNESAISGLLGGL